MATPLMPKATAVWLVDNTSLTFDQIATFCALHPLEVKAIADGESAKLKVAVSKVVVPPLKKKGPRYTPLSKRQDRPNAILWLVRSHPELKDAQIIRLVGTTKTTIEAIKERTHWNSANLQPMDPVTLGLCTQIALDAEVTKAAKWAPAKPEPVEGEGGDTIQPAEETQTFNIDTTRPAPVEEETISADDVFANFQKKSDGEDS